MRNRTALTTAVTSVAAATSLAHEPAHMEDRGHRVFGKVAEPDGGGAGARGQDVELFDATAGLPRVTPRIATPGDGARRSRRSRATPPAWRSMPLPLMVAGALSAGLGAALTVWLAAEPGAGPQSVPSLALPVVATSDRPPARNAVGAPAT
ncbi:hypothetical protein ACH4M4_35190 [Streptomyces sp. NPDC017254]|uniref:hypothetical protein n=1 Tax=unclassified Streptomyces TaxID=2593676 RepID=UPI0037AA393B